MQPGTGRQKLGPVGCCTWAILCSDPSPYVTWRPDHGMQAEGGEGVGELGLWQSRKTQALCKDILEHSRVPFIRTEPHCWDFLEP